MTQTSQMTHFEMVGEFHKTFGHPINTIPQTNIFNEKPNVVNLRVKLIYEEINELLNAIKNRDIIECIDGVCDILYVVYGTFHTIGINYDEGYGNINYNNYFLEQSKLKIQYKCFTHHDLCIKTMYGNDFFKNNLIKYIADLLKEINFYNDVNFYKSLYIFTNKLFDIIILCHMMANVLNISLDKCFDEIHKSNMTKMCINEYELEKTLEMYEKQNIKVNYTICGENKSQYIVKRDSDSKILKSINYKKPDFSDLIKFINGTFIQLDINN